MDFDEDDPFGKDWDDFLDRGIRPTYSPPTIFRIVQQLFYEKILGNIIADFACGPSPISNVIFEETLPCFEGYDLHYGEQIGKAISQISTTTINPVRILVDVHPRVSELRKFYADSPIPVHSDLEYFDKIQFSDALSEAQDRSGTTGISSMIFSAALNYFWNRRDDVFPFLDSYLQSGGIIIIESNLLGGRSREDTKPPSNRVVFDFFTKEMGYKNLFYYPDTNMYMIAEKQ